MRSYLLLGPKQEDYPDRLVKKFADNGHELQVYGDGENHLDCKNIDLPSYSQVIVEAHGSRGLGSNHKILLCNNEDLSFLSLSLIAQSKPLNFELFSCYSGNTITEDSVLPKWSSLITSSSYKSIGSVHSQIKEDLLNIDHNPFIRFVAYVFAVPEVIKFSIQSEETYAFNYSTEESFNSIGNFSDIALKQWQNKILEGFFEFAREIQPKMNNKRFEEINRFIDLFQDDDQKESFINQFDIKYYKGLMLIIESAINNVKKVSALIDYAVDVNTKIDGNKTALHVASYHGHSEVVGMLVEAGADINIKDNYGRTPLHMASNSGHLEVVSKLIEAGAEINDKDNNGLVAFDTASLNTHLEVMSKLIDAGAKSNTNYSGCTPLHIASYYGHLELVGKIVEVETDINTKDNDGFTPLHLASENGHSEVVSKLINAGAEVNAKDNNGWSSLYMASYNGHTELVGKLIDAGAENNIKIGGLAALHLASEKGHSEVVSKLIDAGAEINAKNNNGYTSLYMASYNGHSEVVGKLIDAGVEINTKNSNGVAAFDIASHNAHLEVMSKLIDAGAEVGMSYNGWTAFDIAVDQNYFTVVKKLLSIGGFYNNMFHSEVSEEIKNEVNQYYENPVEYILRHNDKAKTALIGLGNIKQQYSFDNIEEVEECLSGYLEEGALDLNALCGVGVIGAIDGEL